METLIERLGGGHPFQHDVAAQLFMHEADDKKPRVSVAYIESVHMFGK